MSLTLITGPAVEPLSLAEAKLHLRVDDDLTEDDAYIAGLITVARQYLDGPNSWLGRCLVNQTWRLDLCEFDDCVKLPLPPLQSVTHIKYYDTDDVLQTLSTDVYEVLTSATTYGSVHRLDSQSWPTSISADKKKPIQITFVAGFGADWNAVPVTIRHAMLMLIGHWYESREPVMVGESVSTVPLTVEALLSPYRMLGC